MRPLAALVLLLAACTAPPTGGSAAETVYLNAMVWTGVPGAHRAEALARAVRHALALGVTQVHDMGTWADLATYRRAAERGRLPLRVYAFVPRAGWRRLADLVAREGRDAIDDGRWAGKRIGPERIRTTYAFRSLLDAGARLAFGSDWTVAPLSPLEGIEAAVARQTLDGAYPGGWVPEERITVEEALAAYTRGGAYTGFQEDRLGTLEPGKLADFVVLSADLFAGPPAAISEVRVLRTVVAGQEVNQEVNREVHPAP